MSTRVMGKVKFFADDKGYGFITPDTGGKDIFVHRNDFVAGLEKLAQDQRVSFVVGESERKKGDGRKAIQVKVEQ